jgi:hypothetical protein
MKFPAASTILADSLPPNSFGIPICNFFLAVLGPISSGSLNKKMTHFIRDSKGGIIVAFDVIPKPGGEEILADLKKRNKSLGLEGWKKEVRAVGDEAAMKKAMQDLFILETDPEKLVKDFDYKRDLLDKLVALQTNQEDMLMPLHFVNGDACSSGGHTTRTISELSNKIPFFRNFFELFSANFDFTSVWIRSSEDGTHDEHSDTFRSGATNRFILSINCFGKVMCFRRV